MDIVKILKNTSELAGILAGEWKLLRRPKKALKWIKHVPFNTKKQLNYIEVQVEQKRFRDSIARNIAPPVIRELPRYVEINGKKLARCIIVGIPEVSELGGYPPDLSPRFINELLNITARGFNISYNFKLVPIRTTDALKQMDEAVYYNAVNQQRFSQAGNPSLFGLPSFMKQFERETLHSTSRELYTNKHRLFDTSLIITFWAKTELELDYIESHLISILNSNRIGYEIPDYRQKDTFISAMLYPLKADFTMTELFTKDVAMLVPTRNPNPRLSETGLYFGKNKLTNIDVIIDLKSLVANHVLVIGATGSGKTFTVLMLLTRAHDMLGKRVILIEPKDDVTTDYRAVAEYYGEKATIIDIGVGKKNINPLEIMFDANSYEKGDIPIHIYDQHVDLLEYFFNALFEDSMSENMKSYLSLSLREVYRSKGIVRENPDTWVEAKKNKSFPTIFDLRNQWLQDADTNKSISVSAQALVDRSTKMTERWSYLDNQSNIDLSSDFIVIDISNIHGSMQKAMNIFVTGIMSMQFRTDIKKETIIAIDEGAAILRNERLSLFVLRTLTQGRSYNIGLWFITQHTEDLVKADVEVEFKTDIPVKIVLGHLMNKDNIEYTKNFFKLNESDCNNLMACGVGEGLIKVDNEVIYTKFKPTQQEMDIIKGKLSLSGRNISNHITSDIGFKLIHSSLSELVSQQGICFDSWIDGDPSVLKDYGYEPIRVQNALDKGTLRAWIKKDMIQRGMIGNESVDHYSHVSQVAGELRQRDIPINISHFDGADLTAEINGKKIAFEFEIHSKNSLNELLEKKHLAEHQDAQLVFVGTTFNIKQLQDAVGFENALRRGSELRQYLEDVLN